MLHFPVVQSIADDTSTLQVDFLSISILSKRCKSRRRRYLFFTQATMPASSVCTRLFVFGGSNSTRTLGNLSMVFLLSWAEQLLFKSKIFFQAFLPMWRSKHCSHSQNTFVLIQAFLIKRKSKPRSRLNFLPNARGLSAILIIISSILSDPSKLQHAKTFIRIFLFGVKRLHFCTAFNRLVVCTTN